MQFSIDKPTIRVINFKPKGWVIVAGDDITEPIIGYSFENFFDENNLPPQLAYLLEAYAKQLTDDRVKKATEIPVEISLKWLKLKESPEKFKEKSSLTLNTKSGRATRWRLEKDVSLHTPTWGQRNFYNDLCPLDSSVNPIYDGRTPTGCVATAMVQIMRYHSWPQTGAGTHGYSSNYGWEFANFGATTYNWANTPTGIVDTANNDVATAMRHAGVSANMNYGSQGSGIPYGFSIVDNVFRDNFRYWLPNEVRKSDYSDIYEWYQMIKTDLRQGFPVYYVGVNTTSTPHTAHTFIIDGFDVDGNDFEINWGWNGSANGMYHLSDLNGYGNGQFAILGIKPNNNVYRDPYENDNSWQRSSYMATNGINSRKNGHSINPSNDQDWINFYNDTRRTITIETLNSSGDTRMWLYNKDGDQVAYNDDGGSGYLSKINMTLDGGTYYIKVDEYGNNNVIPSYDIRIH